MVPLRIQRKEKDGNMIGAGDPLRRFNALVLKAHLSEAFINAISCSDCNHYFEKENWEENVWWNFSFVFQYFFKCSS